MRRPIVFLSLALAVVVSIVWLSGVPLDLDTLRSRLAGLESWRAARPLVAAGLFFGAYVAVTALSLPLAVWMTLAAGALFGLWWGLLLASFASSVGATLAFLVARWFLRDAVQKRFGDRLKAIDAGFERDGAFYLFTVRLIPVVPFFVVNLVMGLTPIPVLTFYLVSQAGMLAGTVVYVNAGTRLARLESLSGIVSPGLLASFALLGVFPWIARLIVKLVRRRRAYAGWTRPARYDRNLIVIGAGAAGLVAAYIGAAVKARVTLIEGHKMGGDCLNYGCVPSKAIIRSGRLAHHMRHAGDYGLEGAVPEVSFARVMQRVHRVIKEIAPHDSVERYEGLGVEVLKGHARIVDPWTVEVSGSDDVTRLTTRAIIIATGSEPRAPEMPGIDQVGHLTSETMWERLTARDRVPPRLLVLGGGPIGTELAQCFARLGSSVTQVQKAPRILMREDTEVSALAKAALEADGVTVLTDHKALACGLTGGEKWIEVEAAGVTRRIAFDEMIVAVGRKARLEGFGLEELGIPVDEVVETNEYLETRLPNILAAGDVAGPFQFTHVAGHQAWFAAVNGLFGNLWRLKPPYRVIPWATFIEPEVARVGLNEQEAKEKGVAHEVTRFALDDLDRAIVDGSTAGFVKVLTAPGKDRILGVTIVGEHAADLLAEFVLAMNHKLGLGKILGTIHIYPTMAEANKYVAGAWRRAHVSPRTLRWLARFHGWRRGD